MERNGDDRMVMADLEIQLVMTPGKSPALVVVYELGLRLLSLANQPWHATYQAEPRGAAVDVFGPPGHAGEIPWTANFHGFLCWRCPTSYKAILMWTKVEH